MTVFERDWAASKKKQFQSQGHAPGRHYSWLRHDDGLGS